MPVAVSCSDSPIGNDDGLGVMVIETSAAGFIVTEAEPVVLPTAALMVVLPIALAVAIPLEVTATIEGPEELHVVV